MPTPEQDAIRRAADAIAGADALVIGAGAGMGVDSGLPDFRGDHGFWNAYPPYAGLGLRFTDLANPRWFRDDPELAWGFYGHRLHLYRDTTPHEGFGLLRDWAAGRPGGGFVVTSNVDGHFQRSGFAEDRVAEIHGAIDFLQCTRACGAGIFPATGVVVTVDGRTMRATPPLPSCPRCGALARPNILMFGDWDFDDARTRAQGAAYRDWLDGLGPSPRLAIVECGAGTAVPSIRDHCEELARLPGAILVRMNVREPQVPTGHLGLALRALEGLRAIDRLLPGAAAP